MKKIIKLFAYAVLMVTTFILVSCSPSTTITKIYLQDIEISGPINQAPIHITDSTKSRVTISPRIAFNTKKSLQGKIDGHTLVNRDNIYQIDTIFIGDGDFYLQETPGVNRYPFEGKNLIWNFAEVNAAIDFDFKLSKTFALFMGTNYSMIEQKSLWGGLFGFGLMGVGENASFRMDVGLHIQEIPYEAYSVVSVTQTGTSGTSSYITNYLDISKKTHFNPFLNFTVNSSNPEWFVNFFVQAGYSAQGLVDFTPETRVDRNPFYLNDVYITEDQRGEATAGLINFTPGLYFNIKNTGRIILGTRLFWITQIEDIDNAFYFLPMLQFDFNL